ncbi:tumor necrosis factor ligand superfamily member 13 isoform X2 [Astyanax mexicanus]|uniref:tumor necrosis factor ligand superfamily member 13 isoform X2 n=1 Tax=Astyanax mexicanus TaxID=7994 RepID=UPI0020CB08DD|nr:tumor necrosis factor ligand superfamily member 13 isoform X2 [Astyanax mexicanus]
MWHQKSVNVQNESPETLEYGPFPLFAKRSVEVHRQFERECPDPALSLLDDNDAFWDKILQTPSDESLGYEAEAVNMFSTTPVELVCGHVGSSCLETLPSPAHLMGKKRKKRGGGERRDSADRQSSAVTQHIIQLRRKQSYIDSLKGEKWWSSSVWRAEPEWAGPDGEQAESEGETHPHLPDHPFCQEVWMTPAMPIGRKKREASTPKIRRKRQKQRSILHLIPASTNSYGERDLTILTWALGRSQGAGLQVSGETISVVTEGTYFIYSQVLYKDNTWVMGHVITKRLKGAETKLMKCLKSMPSNLSEPVNTCYTAGVHYLESGSVLELSVPRQSAELILWSHATFMGIFSI